MVSVGMTTQLPELLSALLVVVAEVAVLLVVLELLVLPPVVDPPPQLINPVAPIKLKSPSVPSVLRRSLSTAVVADA